MSDTCVRATIPTAEALLPEELRGVLVEPSDATRLRRDSLPQWLSRVPPDWNIIRVKHLGKFINGKAFSEAEWSYEGLPIVRIQNLTNCEAPFNFFSGSAESKFRTNDGDVLISWSASLGVFRWSGGPAWVNQHIYRVEQDTAVVDIAFLYWLAKWFVGILDSRMHGSAMQHVTRGAFEGLRVPRPPLVTQRVIAAFLDRETAKIDALIEKKRRLLDLLDEKRTALITHAVTRGLDPDVPMEDSGTEWLGEVPAHWEVLPIRSLAAAGLKTFTDGDWVESPFIRDTGIRLIQTGNIGIGDYREQGFRYIDDEAFVSLRCTEIQPRNVLICRLAGPVGRACLAPDLGVRMITSVDVCILKPKSEYSPEFIVWALSSRRYLDWLSAVARGGTRDRISRSGLGAVRVPVPPPAGQRQIAEFLHQESGQLDNLSTRIHHAINLLQEYRTALISAAVTGQHEIPDSAA